MSKYRVIGHLPLTLIMSDISLSSSQSTQNFSCMTPIILPFLDLAPRLTPPITPFLPPPFTATIPRSAINSPCNKKESYQIQQIN